MELNQIEAFVAVAQMGSFTRATHVLHLSQPAISRRIQLLEQELGVSLFERVREGIVLTGAGQTFLRHAQRVMSSVQDSIEAVRELQSQAQGTVKLAMVGTLASTDFSHRLIRFRENYPTVQLQLRTALSSEVSDLVRSGSVHLGLRYFEENDPVIVSQLVAEEPLVVVGAGYREWGNGVQLDDLRGLSWVSFPIGQGSSGEPFAQLQARQLELHDLDSAERIYIDSLTAQKRLIEADFGIGLLPLSSVQEELRLGTLQVLPIKALQITAPVMVLYRRDGYLSMAATTLLERLLEDNYPTAPIPDR